jgi:hypothetical protein
MHNIRSTDPRYIKYIDCDPNKQKKIIFEGSSIKIIMGSSVLDSLDLSTFLHPASENGGSMKKRFFLDSKKTYTLHGGNVAQAQGEVSLIIIRAKYDASIEESKKYFTWEYLGKIFTAKNLIFLTGRTLDTVKHHGWDLEPYTSLSPSPTFSPEISPFPTSPDFNLGGILIYNPTDKEMEFEILVMN